MEITRGSENDQLVLTLTGRLDSYWADHLATELEAVVREGAWRIVLDFAQVAFMSSAGISVLLRYYKATKALEGFLLVRNPVKAVRSVFDLSGLTPLLLGEEAATAQSAAIGGEVSLRDGMRCERFTLGTGAATCTIAGTQLLPGQGGHRADDAVRMAFGATAAGLGLGALGRDADEMRGRFGEFVALAGHIVHLPTDGTEHPDYLAARGSYIPDLGVLYGLAFDGPMTHCIRFEPDAPDATADPALCARLALEAVQADAAGFVLLAEIAGLVGAALTVSPDTCHAPDLFGFPRVRTAMTLTAEPSHAGDLALVTGVCARVPSTRTDVELGSARGAFDALLRPLATAPDIAAHMHAAVAPLMVLRRGVLDLGATVRAVFEHGGITALLHLLDDDRPLTGAGTTHLVRGALWCTPLTSFARRS
jgi:anti-anti-sigma factor